MKLAVVIFYLLTNIIHSQSDPIILDVEWYYCGDFKNPNYMKAGESILLYKNPGLNCNQSWCPTLYWLFKDNEIIISDCQLREENYGIIDGVIMRLKLDEPIIIQNETICFGGIIFSIDALTEENMILRRIGKE